MHAQNRPLFVEDDLVGLLCALCGYTFQAGDVARPMVVRAHFDDGPLALETVVVHHDCQDPQCVRHRH